ncbi:hypothetical protein ACJIZ3_020310 [Penstemon smallii]|uniref:SAWADEE domain-containing protein n=1 Tax=Penstemon smallii TaxID=265156 RepID=A0ABD3SIR2_9LAMI
MVLEVEARPEAEAEMVPVELYDLEYRAKEDDAWYSVRVVFDSEAETLTVKYHCFPAVQDLILCSGDFETEEKVDDLIRRFRPLSKQLQDNECRKVKIGTLVCASHAGPGVDDDIKFYDAVIDDVQHQKHIFAEEAEECTCTFVLFWQHGHPSGTLTSANIGSICTMEPILQVDPKICAFAMSVKEKIASSKCSLVLSNHGLPSKEALPGLSLEKNSKSSQNILQEMETDRVCKSLTWKSEGRICNYIHRMNQDDDIGPEPCNIDGSGTDKGQHLILVYNLEKDITPSSIKQFIYVQTDILPQAFVFPSLLHDQFARGAILVDCQQKFQTMYKFLSSPEHLIVSSRGRPWVILEKSLMGAFGTPLWNLIPLSQDDVHIKGTSKELHVVYSGTASYKRAKKLRNIILEYIDHERRVCEKFASDEKKILQSYQSN